MTKLQNWNSAKKKSGSEKTNKNHLVTKSKTQDIIKFDKIKKLTVLWFASVLAPSSAVYLSPLSSLALTVFDLWYSEDLEEKAGLTDWLN